MEALVYDESPLADYLEGDAIVCDSPPCSPAIPPQYAPKGFPNFRERLRSIRRTATSVTEFTEDKSLEQLRYSIIASQLLSEDIKPRARNIDETPQSFGSFSLQGAVLTACLSFFIAWLVQWFLRLRLRSAAVTWSETFLYFLIFLGAGICFAYAARRQYLRFIRHSCTGALHTLVTGANNFDAAAGAALKYIQEVEVIARGYELSHPLPPISRADDKHIPKQCSLLRTITAKQLQTSISQFSHFHYVMQPFLHRDDLNSYHYIYDISEQDYDEILDLSASACRQVQESLKDLRYLYGLHLMVRKLFLIDLLALRARQSWPAVRQWRSVLHAVQTLSDECYHSTRTMQHALAKEDDPQVARDGFPELYDRPAKPSNESTTPEHQHIQAQLRRFETVASGVRGLNTKAKLLRDEVTEMIATDSPETQVSNILIKQYEDLGSELRDLLVEWERGRNTMFLNADSEHRLSNTSSGAQSWPLSPSPSLGGLTVVEGGPGDALRSLTGEAESPRPTAKGIFDEEVFEAISKPRKRMSVAFTREEKLAKLQEERKKRATLQEQADNTTNMLRELQMVIKHRPPRRMSTVPPSI